MNCPACQQEVGDTGLGSLLPHRVQGSEEFCPGYIREEVSVTASPPTAIKEPGRKVRSDKGTKRGQRKQGGDTSVRPPSQEPERVAAGPLGPVEDWLKTSLPATTIRSLGEADSTGLPAEEDNAPKRVVEAARSAKPQPRSAYSYLVMTPESGIKLHDTLKTAVQDAGQFAKDAPQGASDADFAVLVYEVRAVRQVEWDLKVTRLGRVRKAKP